MKKELGYNIIACYRGWWQWRKICKIKGMKKTAVVLIPGEDAQISMYALDYLKPMLQCHGWDNAIILTPNHEFLKKNSDNMIERDEILQVRYISLRSAADLIQLSCLYRFDERFICASLEIPIGRNGSRLIGKKGITKEEIFAVGIYGVVPYHRN